MTYTAEYLQSDDVKAIRRLARVAAENGAESVKVYDSEGFVEKCPCNGDSLLQAIDGLDIDVTLRFFAGCKKLGAFFLVLGNGDDTTVADYGVNDWTDKVWEAL